MTDMTDEKKQRFLQGAWKSIAFNALLNIVLEGKVTISDLEQVGNIDDPKSRDRLNQLKNALEEKGEAIWSEAEKKDTIELYRNYLDLFGEEANHSADARKKIEEKDIEYWDEIKTNPTEEKIEEYKRLFPNGVYLLECDRLDIPWEQAKVKNTIKAYEEYEEKYPGKHVEEIKQLKEDIYDELDWKTACENASTSAYKGYLEKHENGKYASIARERINNKDAREIFLNELREDINKYHPDDIKEKIENNVASWNDLENILGDAKVNAIKGYSRPDQLPTVENPSEFSRGFTEVYFWGLRGTGKTCAIGAVIGYLQSVRRSLSPEICPGLKYLAQLETLFANADGICVLPRPTVHNNLPAMALSFEDNRRKIHRVMLIDVAGEVFSGIYKKIQREDNAIDENEEIAIENLKTSLKNSYNNKIHFFIIEYNDNNSSVKIPGCDGTYKKSHIMQMLAKYFEQERIFKKSSVSMNVLFTKCDRIENGRDRVAAVQDYLKNNSQWDTFLKDIDRVSVAAKCGNINVINFSIGDVFASDLCVFDPSDAEKIVEVIESVTPPYSDNWITRVSDFIRK